MVPCASSKKRRSLKHVGGKQRLAVGFEERFMNSPVSVPQSHFFEFNVTHRALMFFSLLFLLYQNSPRPPCQRWLSGARDVSERTRSSTARLAATIRDHHSGAHHSVSFPNVLPMKPSEAPAPTWSLTMPTWTPPAMSKITFSLMNLFISLHRHYTMSKPDSQRINKASLVRCTRASRAPADSSQKWLLGQNGYGFFLDVFSTFPTAISRATARSVMCAFQIFFACRVSACQCKTCAAHRASVSTCWSET